MVTAAEFAQGTKLKVGDGGGPEVFTTLAEVLDISGPSLSMETVGATSHDSPSGYTEVIAGLKSGGEVTFDIQYIPSNATHKKAAGGILQDFEDRALRNFELVFPDTASTTWSFAAFVTGFEPSSPVEDKITASLTLTISGAPSLA